MEEYGYHKLKNKMKLKDTINYSIWCDFIERDFLQNEFSNLVKDGLVYGATSNPTIFKQAISNSSAYNQQMNMLQVNDAKNIYEELAIFDIKMSAEILKPLYDINSNDGLISIEVDPSISHNSEETINEAIRLHNKIGFDNVMIKIPATSSGYKAMEYLTSIGISVNATLVFSPQQAKESANALDIGIKKSAKDTKGVVSIFVSRFDRKLDHLLNSKNLEISKTGIINATKCYHTIKKFENDNIRTLFASTAVRDENLTPTYYVENLVFPNSINTTPLMTVKEWDSFEKKEISSIMEENLCDKYFEQLLNHQIDINLIYNELFQDGLSAFKVSFTELLKKVKL